MSEVEVKEFSTEQLASALGDINQLSLEEYGQTLEQVLESPLAEERLHRLAGVILKKPFATSHPPAPDRHNPTSALRSWHWDISKFDNPSLVETEQYQLLKQIRDDEVGGDWKNLESITNEAGLMYVLGKWIKGRLEGDQKSFKQVYYEPQSPGVGLALKIVDLLPIASVLGGFIGIPALAVNLALIVTQFGYEKLVNPPVEPDLV